MRADEQPRNLPRPSGENRCPPPGQGDRERSGPSEVRHKQVIETPQQRQHCTHGIQRISEVVVREARVAEQVTGGSPQDEEPDSQDRERRSVIKRLLAARWIEPQHAREDQRQNRAGFLRQNQRHACQRGERVLVLEEQQQRERCKQHRWHVELGHHRLCVEQRIEQQQDQWRVNPGGAEQPA
jgi:hypothetical protein